MKKNTFWGVKIQNIGEKRGFLQCSWWCVRMVVTLQRDGGKLKIED